MSESKIKLLILTWPRRGPQELPLLLEAGLGRSRRGRHFGAPLEAPGQVPCHSQSGVADRPDRGGSSCHNGTDGFSSPCSRRVGTSVLLCPSFIQNPHTQVFCHEMRGSFMCVCTQALHRFLSSHTVKEQPLPPPPAVNSPPVARCSSE